MKVDSIFYLQCECGYCKKERNYFSCKGCQADAPYCLGQDDDYFDYCTPCWYQLSEDLVTVVVR
jgi:hypothetical protein